MAMEAGKDPASDRSYVLFESVICSREMARANRMSNKPYAEFTEVRSICLDFMGATG